MQEKSDRLKDFLDRFAALGVRIGQNTVGTCKAVGISRSLFYEIRDGNRDLTSKMEARLEGAERQAGILPDPPGTEDPVGNLNDSAERLEKSGAFVREESALDELRRMSREIKGPIPSKDLGGFLERIAVALERLVEIEEERKPKP